MVLLAEFLGAVFRWALAALGVWLVAHGVITLDQSNRFLDAAVQFLSSQTIAVLMAIVPLAWSLWAKYKSRLKFLAALELPAGASEAEAKDVADIAKSDLKPFVTR